MYRLSPFTYLIEAMLGQGIGHSEITCAAKELATIEPPSGQTCGEYMGAFIEASGGYLTNENDTSSCHYCAYRTTDAFLEQSFNIYYSHHWRDFGIFCAYILFNVSYVSRRVCECGALTMACYRLPASISSRGCSASGLGASLAG